MNKLNKDLNKKEYKNKWFYVLLASLFWLVYQLFKSPETVVVTEKSTSVTSGEETILSGRKGTSINENLNTSCSNGKIC